jgi:hypothetical protein
VFLSLLSVRALISLTVLGGFVSTLPRNRGNVGEQIILQSFVYGISVGVAVLMGVLSAVFVWLVTLDERCCLADYQEGCCKSLVSHLGRGAVGLLGVICALVFALLMVIAPNAVAIITPIAVTFALSLAHSETWVWTVFTTCRYCCVACGDRRIDAQRTKAHKEVVKYETLQRYLAGEDIDADGAFAEDDEKDGGGVALVAVKTVNPASEAV